MKKEDIKFQIDQLRKDKMIYALESIATTLAMIVFASSTGTFFYSIAPFWLVGFSSTVAVGYWIFTVYGNTKRLLRIKELEKKLK